MIEDAFLVDHVPPELIDHLCATDWRHFRKLFFEAGLILPRGLQAQKVG